ncbi:helix-turn-helix domain-containing protein [Arthrobacter agilis]|jgi:ribosome-binding protein aMBF1 (putative translation factor)|uniref:helix-turn-helix domain-containing protein n=1 Tax=Arthrobacter agilis TaxID=37921 RepID=UPI0027838477|nr:helix-turn-helix transcriptional regulator [Arthrobacter agilis]MDQ0736394.1 ribosome-binding protein aMBF1 (putative translation factor) [Arthrobacter agilis]
MGEILYFPLQPATARRREAPPREQRRAAGPPRTPEDAGRSREPLLREAYGEVLRDLRLDRGERLTDVAGRAAISPQYLSEIERGRKDASSEILAAIARSLGVTVRTLSSHVAARMARGGTSRVDLAA